jgi:hypothetical protein
MNSLLLMTETPGWERAEGSLIEDLTVVDD